jgi:hypothetical protein
LKPPASPALSETISTCQRLRSAKRVYMRKRVAREQRALVPAGAGADLEEEVLVVVGIARQQHALQVVLERAMRARARADLLLGELAHLGIARHLLGGGEVALGLAVLVEELDHGLDLGALLRELAEAVAVVVDLGIGERASISFSRESRLASLAAMEAFMIRRRLAASARDRASRWRASALALALAGARQRLAGVVQELVGDALGERLEDRGGIVAAREPRTRPRELGLAVLVGALAQLDDCRTAARAPCHERNASTCFATMPSASAAAARRLSAPSCTIEPRSSMV